MKKLLLLGLLYCAAVPLCAQKVFFIYIQSDSRVPFYVKMGEQVHSSTASGYLILSKLKDSTYGFQLGPSANEPELRFEVPLRGNDRGFLLKKFPEGWGLFDLQSLAVINPVNKNLGGGAGARVKEGRFTTLLARAADDTTLLYQPVVVSSVTVEKKRPDVMQPQSPAPTADSVVAVPADTTAVVAAIAPTKSNDSVASAGPDPQPEQPVGVTRDTVNNTTSPVVTAPDSVVVAEPVFKRSVVTRRSESSNVEGFGLVFWDDVDGAIDTIRLVIPNPKVIFAEQNVEAETPPVAQKAAAPANACKAQAGDKDYFKLRKNLASIETEAQMTEAALGAFRKKCFTTEQVKNLSSLFLTQSGKYAFFEAAYPFVSDREKFAALASELFDAAFITRFKALTAN